MLLLLAQSVLAQSATPLAVASSSTTAAGNQSMAAAESTAPVSPPVVAEGSCELDVLTALGWQQAYNPGGYSIQAELPINCTLDTWQSLGCVYSLVGS